MRQFYLVNEVGTTYFFDYRNQTLISDIDDIGYEKENTYLTYENTFKKVDEKVPQKDISFSVVFLRGYKGYGDFLTYIKNSTGELRLFYKIGSSVRYLVVSFKSISKTQLDSGVIQSTLVLEKMSLWLNRVNYFINVNENKNGKIFPFTYPYEYSSSFNGEISVSNNGEYKAPLYVCITGAVNNPEVEVIKDGVVVSKLRFVISSGSCVIEVNAEPTNQYMKIIEKGEERNIYALQDFTCDNFLFLDKGTYTVKFKPGVNSVTTCKITVLEGYGGH